MATSCAAPVVAVASDGSRAVDADGDWMSAEPPCQRSAGFRIGLGALLLICGGLLAYGASVARRLEPT